MKGWIFNFVAAGMFELAGVIGYFVGNKAMGLMFIILGFSQLLLGLANLEREKEQKGLKCS